MPENNKLSWGTVYGASSDVAERYPVIIQFYKGDEAVHVAQVDVLTGMVLTNTNSELKI